VGAKQHKRAKMLNHLSITELSSVAYSNLSVKFLLRIVYVPSYSVNYIHKNTIYGKKSFLSTESNTKILQSIYFAYKVNIISSY